MPTPTIIGNVEPSDDHNHPLGPEPNFNESVYFNLFDREHEVGGFLRIGNRANEGYGEVTVCLFLLKEGRLLFQYHRPAIETNERFDAAGFRVDVLEPGQRLRTAYDGPAFDLRDPRQLVNPGQAFKANPQIPLRFDLVHEGSGPLYGHKEGGDPEALESAPEALHRRDPQMGAASHFEQHMRVTGTLEVDGRTISLDGLGLRDHSWGPRTWQEIRPYVWSTISFTPSFGMTSLVSWGGADRRDPRPGGFVVRNGELISVTGVDFQPDYEDAEKTFLRAYRKTVMLSNGEQLEIEARVREVAPLRNRRGGLITRLGEALTEYHLDGLTGFGMTEYLDQVQPA